jgi:hypothetical protein
MESRIEIYSENGARALNPNCLIVGWDETGHEQYADSHYPLFGLGGCAVLAKDYRPILYDPWIRLRTEHFPGLPGMHAADMRELSETQMRTLASFFADGKFFRFAALTSLDTACPPDVDQVGVVVRQALQQLTRITERAGADSVALILEDSRRLHSTIVSFISGYQFRKRDGNEMVRLPMFEYRGTKDLREPLLEVADFVIHTAGSEVRSRLNGYSRIRRDFRAVFVPQGRTDLAEFIKITEVKVRKPGIRDLEPGFYER